MEEEKKKKENPFKRVWTKQKLAKIVELRKKGWTVKQIATYFNKSETALSKVIQRYNINLIQKRAKKKRTNWTQKMIAQLYKLLVIKKLSTKDVAMKMGLPKNEIKIKASNLGFYTTLRDRRKIPLINEIQKDKRKGDKIARDLATRVMELRGEKAKGKDDYVDFDDEQIRGWLNGLEGFNNFCKEVLGVTLQEYQLKMASKILKKKRTALVIGRQAGKDFTISCFAIWLCVCHTNEKVLLVSPAQRQSDMLYKRILTFIATVPELDLSVQRQTAEFTIFQNGSELYTLPSTSYIRGYTEVTWIFVNEAAYAPDEVFCYDNKTEILTDNGFKLFKNLTNKDLVMQYEPEKRILELVKPLDYYEKNFDGVMRRIKHRKVDLLVTNNHNVCGWDRKGKKFVKRISELSDRYYLPTTGFWRGKSINRKIFVGGNGNKLDWCGEEFASFMGMWLSEGCVIKDKGRYYCIISQQGENVKEWDSKLKELGINVKHNGNDWRYGNKELCNYLLQFGKSYEKFVPKEIKNATIWELKEFLEWYFKGDGNLREGRNTFTISTASKKMADDLMEIGLKIGYTTSSYFGKNDYHGIYNISFTPKSKVMVYSQNGKKNHVFYEGYVGKVYSVKTNSGFIVVRRNGKISISGNSALEPMLSIKDGSMVLMGTPAGCQGYFWEAFNNVTWSRMQLPSTVNKYIKKSWFEDQRKTMRPEEYDIEINANFSQILNNFFPPEIVNKCSKEYDYREFPEDKWVYYCGVDWGRIHDSSVICVLGKRLKDKELQVINMKEMRRTSFPQQIEYIVKLHERFNFKNLMVEYAGLGIPPSEDLKNRGLPVKFFTPSLQEKEKAYNELLKVMESGKLTINSKDRKLQYELKMFRYELSKYGKMKLHHMSGGSDDFCDALCFAVNSSKVRRIWFGVR